MSDAATHTQSPVLAVVTRIPATLAMIGVILVVGIIWQGLWQPFEDSPVFPVVAYGLPAFEAGRWWTPFTGTFFVNQPWVYAFTITGFVGMAYLEFRRGSRVALAYYWVGQLFAICATALLLWLLSMLPWAWAATEAAALDVGASGGTMACIAAAVGLFRAPWRVRAWLVLLGTVFVAMLFWGALADLEHLMAVLLILFVDRSLRIHRTTIREQRLIAFIAVLVLGAVEVITLIVPTDGPFGPTEPASGGFIDVAVDAVVILVVANGLRRGRRWSWIVAIVLAALNILTAALVLLLIVLTSEQQLEATIDGETELSLASGVMWLLMLVYLIWVRRAFRARRKSRIGRQPAPTVDDVVGMLHSHGGGTLSWMTTWEGNTYARTADGIVAYQRRNGVALALADPLGPEASRAASVGQFIHDAERAGLVPCFFSASEATRAAVPSSWRSLVVADDTIVDLVGLEFTGKRWNSVRTSLNRAGREDMTFRMTHLKDEPWGVQQQLRAISELWVGDKDLPEMGFTLGTLVEAESPEVRLALAIAPNGDVDGFLSWLPVYGGDGRVRGWTLDLMRRRDGGFAPVMEYLIGSSARLFSDEGAEIMSLSGAPLAHDYPPDAGMIAALSDRLADALEPVYGFRSLHRFKEKFHPRYETMYLLYRDETDLTRIGGALTRAFLPDATLRQFAGAGLELVRGDSGGD
ncbi:bifunctional lysylphosphatidylglycerol flippase/synthetase MprF [Microbacterium sp. NPDC058389]|uniref:bifunctional lysylphosphatidylglycerol flippase/synthetase MprF n=1 Tax=Microbacterium sp. NPDC058389 TaxID=3346475 RepID=UPI0036690EBF